MSWYVAWVAPGNELAFKEDMEKHGHQIVCLMSSEKKISRKTNKQYVRQRPAFSGYVFVRLDQRVEFHAFKAKGFIKFLQDGGKLWDGKDSVIDELLVMQDRGEFDNLPKDASFGLEIGSLVRFISGPFSGMKGRVSALLSSKTEVCIMIGSTQLRVGLSILEKLDHNAIPDDSEVPGVSLKRFPNTGAEPGGRQ